MNCTNSGRLFVYHPGNNYTRLISLLPSDGDEKIVTVFTNSLDELEVRTIAMCVLCFEIFIQSRMPSLLVINTISLRATISVL